MGLDLGRAEANVPINFTKDEINQYVKRFKSLDIDNKGYITVNDLRRYFKVRRKQILGVEINLTHICLVDFSTLWIERVHFQF